MITPLNVLLILNLKNGLCGIAIDIIPSEAPKEYVWYVLVEFDLKEIFTFLLSNYLGLEFTIRRA